jgi:dTDP-glucose 4,6-dehydratase
MKNLLITGCAGFIGSNLTNYLFERGYNIIGLDKLTYAGNIDNVSDLIGENRFEFVKYDINNIFMCANKEIDLVINLAAETHVDNSIENSTPFLNTNCLGIQKVLEFCKYKQIPLIHFSTDEVYGSSVNNYKFTEDDKLNPGNPYSATKAFGDMLIQAYNNTFGLKYIIVRPMNNYGINQHSEKFIPTIINSLLNKKKVPIYGEGMQVRNWLYVEDTCRAIELLINKGEWNNIYNIGTDYWKHNIDTVSSITDKIKEMNIDYTCNIEHVPDRLGHDNKYRINSSKINDLGWKPEVSWDDGIERTIKYYAKEAENVGNK